MSSNPAVAARNIAVPVPVLVVFRGIGQVFFQENALSGALFFLGIAFSSPVMALGLLAGVAIGTATAWLLKFDRGEWNAGIFGFNAALVGIATLFFFQVGSVSLMLLLGGSVVATILTRLMRASLPFPTYTTPFIVTTWGVYLTGQLMGATATDLSAGPMIANFAMPFKVEAAMHGIGQVMFQASFWTGLFFLAGIAISNRCHAAWVFAGSAVGMLVASHHVTVATRAIDPERLVEREQFSNILLGLYGYNATLAPVALYLFRPGLIAPILGMVLTVIITEHFPRTGLPALTAPFVLATWIVLGFFWLERRIHGAPTPSA